MDAARDKSRGPGEPGGKVSLRLFTCTWTWTRTQTWCLLQRTTEMQRKFRRETPSCGKWATQPHICSKSPSPNLTFTQNQIFLKSHSHNLTLTKHGTHSTWDLTSLTHILSLLLTYSTNIFSTPHPGDPTFTEPHIPSAHAASRVALCACSLVFCNAVRLCAAEPLHQDEIWEVEFMRNTLLLRVYVCRSGWKVSWVACDCGHRRFALGMEECWKWGIQVIAVSLH